MKIQKINLFNIVNIISNISDMVSPVLIKHQIKVGYISLLIGQGMGLSTKKQNEVLIAGLLHDIGATSLKERLDLLNFEFEDPHHAERGYILLKKCKYFKNIAKIIRFHHFRYDYGKGLEFKGEKYQLKVIFYIYLIEL